MSLTFSKLMFFKDVCVATARNSEANCKCSAVLVDSESRIISYGYNNETPGIENLEDKETVIHSEQNAILTANRDMEKERILLCFCNRMPCNKCCSLLLKYHIQEIHFLQPLIYKKTTKMCNEKGVKLVWHRDERYLRKYFYYDDYSLFLDVFNLKENKEIKNLYD